MRAPTLPTSWKRSGKSSTPNRPAARWRRPRCTKGWPRSAADAKRPNGSATTCAGSCSPAERCENPRRRSRSRRIGQTTPLMEGLRRAYGGPGGVGFSGGEREGLGDVKAHADANPDANPDTRNPSRLSVGSGAQYRPEARGHRVRCPAQGAAAGGYIEPYPSPSLAMHGLYRLTDQGIAAADEADSP